jgi:16S rRNA (cytidine1402-2'-O)-methyltransferase
MAPLTRKNSSATDRLAPVRRYVIAGHMMDAPQAAPGLHIIATPIGNLRDVTLRALETLAGADLIACEDTRVTRKLLDHYAIQTPLIAYHDHNAASVRPKLLARLTAGEAVALVSDAGTPLISDPGYKLVCAAQEAGHTVTTAPGPSSVLAALAVAGLPTDRFHFEGFLPPKDAGRQARLRELARLPASLVFFESGPRLAAALAAMADAFGAREAAVCRELTKLYEEVVRGDLVSLAQRYAKAAQPRGEIAVVVGPPPADASLGERDLDALLRAALARISVKDAVAEVASATGLARGDVYKHALTIVQERKRDGGAAV